MKKPNFERCDAFVQQFESVAVQMGLPDTDAQFERLREQMREYHAARREAGDGPANTVSPSPAPTSTRTLSGTAWSSTTWVPSSWSAP